MYKTSDMDVNAQIIINANKDIKKNRIIINKFINGIIFYYIMACFQGFYPSNLKKKKKTQNWLHFSYFLIFHSYELCFLFRLY